MASDAPIVIASTDFRPMVGGVADYLHRVAEALAAGHDVTVATSVPDRGLKWSHTYRLHALPPLPDRRLGRRVGDGVPVLRKLHTGAHFLALKRYARTMVRRVARDGSGARVIVGIWDTASHFWCEACRDHGVDYALVAYGVELLLPLYGQLPEWRRTDFVNANPVIAVSAATADLAINRLGLVSRPVIVNPIAGEPLTGPVVERRAEELRQMLGEGAGPVLLSVGRLVARKGFDAVIDAVAALRADFPQARYLIVGEGPERSALESRAAAADVADRILMLGRADDAMKWAAYRRCDLFVMPNRPLGGSDWEGFGIVFAEAARAGRAVVAGRSGGVADAVIDGETGLLIDTDVPGAVTAAVRELLNDGPRRRAMGIRAAQLAAERFTADALRAQLLARLQWN